MSKQKYLTQLFIFTTCLLLFACGTKQQEAKQTQYTEEEFVIRGSVLQNPDSMDYYAALAEEGDARGLYVMAASYYCAAEAQPLPVGVTRVHTRAEADSLLDAAANQGYKPAIKTRECFRECKGE